MKIFSELISAFLVKYLPQSRGFSPNTVASYRDAFILFLQHMETQHGIKPDMVEITDFSLSNVENYLTWLEASKGNSVPTRNNRLAAIKSFFRYVQTVAPEWISIAKPILSIKAKKSAVQSTIAYLSAKAVGRILHEAMNSGGIRDAALLSLLYDSGARVQEIADINIDDVRVTTPCTARLTGKGRKTRIVPISPQVANILRKYVNEYGLTNSGEKLFTNWMGDPIGRAGIAYILKKHVTAANMLFPDIVPRTATPHQLRHSRSMHLLENGVNLIYIRDLLGHSSVTVTEVYAKANAEVKRKAIERASSIIIDESKYDNETKKDLLVWLKSVI
jgi:site-specific recombinase XerD